MFTYHMLKEMVHTHWKYVSPLWEQTAVRNMEGCTKSLLTVKQLRIFFSSQTAFLFFCSRETISSVVQRTWREFPYSVLCSKPCCLSAFGCSGAAEPAFNKTLTDYHFINVSRVSANSRLCTHPAEQHLHSSGVVFRATCRPCSNLKKDQVEGLKTKTRSWKILKRFVALASHTKVLSCKLVLS